MLLAGQVTDGRRTFQSHKEFLAMQCSVVCKQNEDLLSAKGSYVDSVGKFGQCWYILSSQWSLLVPAQHHIHIASVRRSLGRPHSSRSWWCLADTNRPSVIPSGLGTGLNIASEISNDIFCGQSRCTSSSSLAGRNNFKELFCQYPFQQGTFNSLPCNSSLCSPASSWQEVGFNPNRCLSTHHHVSLLGSLWHYPKPPAQPGKWIWNKFKGWNWKRGRETTFSACVRAT